jgi:hypothetical protein
MKRCFWVFPGPGFPFRYFSARKKDSYIGKTVRQNLRGKSKNAAQFLSQLSNTPRAIKNELLIVCFLLRESDLNLNYVIAKK